MTNPLLTASTLPFALPPFRDIRTEHFAEAFETGFAEELAEVEAITSNPEPPTLENTVAALELAGRTLYRTETVFHSLCSTDSTPELDALESEFLPRIAAHEDAIVFNSALFERIAVVHQNPDANWTPEQRLLVERTYQEFVLKGAALPEADRARLGELNQQLAVLESEFGQRLQADTNDLAVVIDDEAQLDGLDEGERAAAAATAADRGLDGKWVVSLVLPTGHPWLANLTNRELRERIYRASLSRGERGNEHDTQQIVRQMVRLRAERARLLGYPNHAAVKVAMETAKTPEAALELLHSLAPAARRNADAEAEVLRAEFGQDDFAAWDWEFVTERVRAREHNIDTAAIRPYFEAERVLQDGVFYAANLVYGISFREREDLHGYREDNRLFEVLDADGSTVGLFLLDLYTRDNKRGGAWMNGIVDASAEAGNLPVVMNNLNVPKPPAGSPTLLTLDEVETMFHEFGHALHGLFARTQYPRFAELNEERDAVEFPSQVNEMWMLHPRVLSNYAKHYETGAALDADTAERLRGMGAFNQGFGTSEYLAAAVLDLALHSLTVEEADALTDLAAFEEQALGAVGLANPLVPPRYRSTYFQHIFGGGYSAGYYGYIWSEVMDADTVEAFEETDDIRALGQRFRDTYLSKGGATDPREAYREFRGRDAAIEPLLRRRGLD